MMIMIHRFMNVDNKFDILSYVIHLVILQFGFYLILYSDCRKTTGTPLSRSCQPKFGHEFLFLSPTRLFDEWDSMHRQIQEGLRCCS